MRVAKLYKDNTEQITNIHYRSVKHFQGYFRLYLAPPQQWWAEHHNLQCRRPDYHLRLWERDPEAGAQQQKVTRLGHDPVQHIILTLSRYGVDLIHFTQNKGHAVHASTKENDIIRFRIRCRRQQYRCCHQREWGTHAGTWSRRWTTDAGARG